MEQWTQNTQTQADVEVFILDQLCTVLPHPPFTEDDTKLIAARIYDYVWQRSAEGYPFAPAA